MAAGRIWAWVSVRFSTVMPTGSVAAWRLEVPPKTGAMSPSWSAPTNRPRASLPTGGAARTSPRGVGYGARPAPRSRWLLAQRADSRILITDVDSARSAGEWGSSAQAYTPVFIDCPPSSGYSAGGPVWEEALRDLGLGAGDDHTQ